MFMARLATTRGPDREGTRARVVAAAAELFAAHGFHGTTIRDIATRARVNVAASHYHFGSKRDLYLTVLREQFAVVRHGLDAAGARLSEDLSGLSRPRLEDLFARRARAILQILLGPPPSLHARLMLREMVDPTEALVVIVKEFVEPMLGELVGLLQRLAPELNHEEIERCAMSVIAQAAFYHHFRPALTLMRRDRGAGEFRAEVLAEHLVRFSLNGMSGLSRARRTPSGRATPRPRGRHSSLRSREVARTGGHGDA